MKRTNLLIVFFMIMALTTSSGTKASNSLKGKKTFANESRFEYFSYTGNDEYYDDNPLTDSNCLYNPVLAGWYSDPSICRVGDDYFMVASTFCYYPGVPIFHSKDLVNWRQIGNVLNRPQQLAYLAGQEIGKGGIYAPTIRYNPHNKLYYMITTDVGALPYPNGRGAGGMKRGSHFYVTTSDPFSNDWSDPIWLPDVPGIDPDFFFDDNGDAYIIHKEDTEGRPKWSNNRALRIIRFDTTTGKTVGEDQKFFEEGVGPEERLARNEGPHIYKIRGRYYLVCAEGGTGQNHSAVVYRADKVTGPYTRWARNPMITMRGTKGSYPAAVTCTGHADLVDTPEGDWWAVFLACRPGVNGVEQLGRETFMLPVKWSKDGYPYLLQERDTVPLIISRKNTCRKASTLSGNFTWRDDFSGNALRSEWITPWGSPSSYCTLKKGALYMKPSVNLPQNQQPLAFIAHRIQHHKFMVETEMRAVTTGNAVTGIMVMRNETRNYVFGIRQANDGKAEMTLVSATRNGYKTEALQAITTTANSKLQLKVICHGDKYDFLFSTDSGTTWTTLYAGASADYVSQRTGGFTGTVIGLCSLLINESSKESE